ncbi:sideroflexin-1-like [Agrilus planipennis]|uniref:Sideroflexin-1-like n=1 Tax=Agrilus planipennis TaxID=224129 RepID=A0A1W4WSJ3_AGRPL|nr:sideroflexin-1-like [Agrilus planipennis]
MLSNKKVKINVEDVDIDKPLYDMDSYIGRVKYFFYITNPLNAFATNAQLDRAKTIVEIQRKKGKQNSCIEVEDLYRAKILYESAFHPGTGEKQTTLGRMSAQLPANTVLAACLTYFYKSMFSVVFWQWINQSFNALVNYTNRSSDSETSTALIMQCYLAAVFGAVSVSLIFKRLAKSASPVVGRFVPYIGCSAAHFVNVPLMRRNELQDGATLFDENGKKVGRSKTAAKRAIMQVVATRVAMSALPMLGTPVVIDYLIKQGIHFKNTFGPELALQAVGYAISIPTCLALFKPYQRITFRDLEEEAQEEVKAKTATKQRPYACAVYFNKGL